MARLVGVAVLALVVAGTGGADIAIGAKRGGAAPSATAPVILKVRVVGKGTITSTPAGISCSDPNGCQANFASGTTVTLTPTAPTGWAFHAWDPTGPCARATGACQVRVTAAFTEVVALFVGVDIESVNVTGAYRQSLLRGNVTVAGAASNNATIAVTIVTAPPTSRRIRLRPVVVSATTGGAFREVIPLPQKGLLPGRFIVLLEPNVTGRAIPQQTFLKELAPPREGIASDAWISPTGSSRRAVRLRRAKSITAFFVWAQKPFPGSQVRTTWFFNGRNTKVTRVQPRFLPSISHVLRFSRGRNLPKGTYRSVLTARGSTVAVATIRIG